jgi:hypothetical protein
MATRARLWAALCALITAVIVVWQSPPPAGIGRAAVQLRSTDAPMTEVTTIKSPVLPTTNPSPFDACRDIPLDAVAGMGLAYTPPTPEEGLRCHYDAGNYQLAVETIVWRTYADTLPADAIETTVNGRRAAQFWVMKPTDWNNRWWISCMVAFPTSYGLIQQSLFYSPVYSDPDVDCLSENLMRAQQLSPYYIF